MYLHIGADVSVRTEEIVGIFDLDNASSSHLTRAFLREQEKSGSIVNVAEDLPKSFVVCREKSGSKTYLSQLNSATLLKRAEQGSFE